MATFFIDIDGTLVEHGTDKFLEGALESLKLLKEAGHKIILTTLRGRDYKPPSPYSQQATIRMLNKHSVKYDQIIWDLPSPRIVINDDGAFSYSHKTNSEFHFRWMNIE